METDAITTLLRDVAAAVITPRFRALAQAEVMEKNPGDLVTVADREAEVLITDALRAAYPGTVVLGEEASAADPAVLTRYAGASHSFTVDPVDGTRNFVHGSPDHAVMAAELREGAVTRSWIWQPQHETLFVAERGAGVRRDGVALAPAVPHDGVPRGATSRRSWVGRAFPGLDPLALTWVCCGVDYPQLLTGGIDYLLYSGSRPWDHAPGLLMLTELGGAVVTLDGAPYDPRAIDSAPLVAARDADLADRVARIVSAEIARS